MCKCCTCPRRSTCLRPAAGYRRPAGRWQGDSGGRPGGRRRGDTAGRPGGRRRGDTAGRPGGRRRGDTAGRPGGRRRGDTAGSRPRAEWPACRTAEGYTAHGDTSRNPTTAEGREGWAGSWVCVGVWPTQWVSVCVGVWVCGCVSECVCECVGVWVCGCVGVWVCVSECVGGWYWEGGREGGIRLKNYCIIPE